MKLENLIQKISEVVDMRKKLLSDKEANIQNAIFCILDLFNCSTTGQIIEKIRVTNVVTKIKCEVSFKEAIAFYQASDLPREFKEMKKTMERIETIDVATFEAVRNYLRENQEEIKMLNILIGSSLVVIEIRKEALQNK